jgi:hypothetical protein
MVVMQQTIDSGVDRVRVCRECRFDKSCQATPLAFGNNHIHLIGPNVVTDGHAAKALVCQFIDSRDELLV